MDRSSMGLDHLLHDGEPQTHTGLLRLSRDLVELFENVLQMIRGNALAGIFYRKTDVRIVLLCPYGDSASGGCEADSV